MRQRGARVRSHVGVLAVPFDHLGGHADDVADLRVRQAHATQVGHACGSQAVQCQSVQFGDRITRISKLLLAVEPKADIAVSFVITSPEIRVTKTKRLPSGSLVVDGVELPDITKLALET